MLRPRRIYLQSIVLFGLAWAVSVKSQTLVVACSQACMLCVVAVKRARQFQSRLVTWCRLQVLGLRLDSVTENRLG